MIMIIVVYVNTPINSVKKKKKKEQARKLHKKVRRNTKWGILEIMFG